MTQQEIYQQMTAAFAAETGFLMSEDADLAVRMHALAAQIAALYTEAAWVTRQCFPQLADGQWLDYHAQTRGLRRREGTKARGQLQFWLETAQKRDVYIPAGTVCTDAGLVRFVTTEAAVIPAGELWVYAPAEAESAGAAGNAVPGTIVYLTKPPSGIGGVSNTAAFVGGMDPEDDENLRTRVLESYRRLPNGANAAFYENRVLETEGVAACSILPRYRGVGTVGVVLTGADGSAPQELLDRVQADLERVREIACDVVVLPPTPVTVDVAVEVTPGYPAVLEAVRTAIAQYFTGERLGKPLYLAGLGKTIFSVEGVENYRIIAPTADVAISPVQLPRLGTLTVTEATV